MGSSQSKTTDVDASPAAADPSKADGSADDVSDDEERRRRRRRGDADGDRDGGTSSPEKTTAGGGGSGGDDGGGGGGGGEEGGGGGGGGCPMKRSDGSYSYSLSSWFGGVKNPHLPGSGVSAPSSDGGRSGGGGGTGAEAGGGGGGGGCPVRGDDNASPPPPAASPSSSSGCPVRSGSDGGSQRREQQQQQQQYNVYSQPIDPSNQMPAVANQLPSPGQKEELDTERARSTIPKGGASDGTTWTYPSPQMFYNSLARKNKLGDTSEEDIPSVVALHNNMNETTWSKVLEWESVLDPQDESEDGTATTAIRTKLLKFMGRPSDLSPKARFKHHVLGHPLPFDRHDWTIIRSDGSEVRYVIDYYHDESRADEAEGSGMPGLHDRDAVRSILVDVRPALDGPSALLDRAVRMPFARRTGMAEFEPLPLMPTKEMRGQVKESKEVWDEIQRVAKEREAARVAAAAKDEEPKKEMAVPADHEEREPIQITKEEARKVAENFAAVLRDCQRARRAVEDCDTESDCAKASLGLTMCMAKIICPLQHSAVTKSLASEGDGTEAEYDARVEKSLENMTACVSMENERYGMARMAHPDEFSKRE